MQPDFLDQNALCLFNTNLQVKVQSENRITVVKCC